jgi:hypothetical protein
MGYSDVFGGNLIFPSRVTYLALTTAIDVVLQWPTEQQITGGDVVADIIDVNTTAGGLNIDMPDARNTSLGNKATFNNVGGVNVFTVRDNTGGTIQSVQPGEQWVIVLTDNSTDMGVWTTFQLGGNAATQASASALAGDGLRPFGIQLDQIIDSDVEAGTPFTVVNGDRAKCLIYTAGAGTCNLPSPGVVFNNWFFMLRNAGSGTLNIVPPSGDIDGASSLNLDPNGSTFIFTDGTDFFTIGLTVASTIAFDFVSLAVPGSGDFVLSGANLDRISYRFTGALTGNRRIVVPNTTQQYWADNQTSGAFSLEVSTAAGAGITIPQGQSVIVYCDATDVINATSSTSVAFPITIGQGGTSATDAPTALVNLGAVAETFDLIAGDGMVGGGDLSSTPRTFDFNLASIGAVAPALGDFMVLQDVDGADINIKATLTDILALGGVTIEDEGVPLATQAQVLDFVGGFVTASGGGTDKTITIGAPLILLDNEQIRFGTGNDIQFQWDGTQMEFLGAGPFHYGENSDIAIQLKVLNFRGGIELEILDASGDGRINDTFNTGGFVKTYIDLITSDGSVQLNFGNVPVARSAAVSGAAYPYFGTSGGFLVNNNTTGTGSNERVLTYIDHAMTGGIADDRSLTTTMAADNRLVAGFVRRQGYVKFEVYASFSKVGGTAQIEFDFDGTNIIECSYIYDFRTADGTPSGAGASDDAATNQSLTLGSAGERTYLRITGYARFDNFSSTFDFRWRPTVNQIDTVSRNSGGWMTICPVLIE